jgi:hypothetical protein
MNGMRMFAFVAAVLITVSIFSVIADGFTFEQPLHATIGVAATGAATSDDSKTAAD